MSAIVIDSSMAAGWVLPDESPDADKIRQTAPPILPNAPIPFYAEFRNLALKAERQKRISTDDTDRLIHDTDQLAVILNTMPDSAMVVYLARKHGLTVYDALYVELAIHKRLPLRRSTAR